MRFTLSGLLCLLLFLPVLITLPTHDVYGQSLRISANGRYIERADGTPFFYLGDTAWELFHRLNREEAEMYLQNRASKGFTVIQAVVLAERAGLEVPNPYGHLPLVEKDPTRPVEEYFRHVDFIVETAKKFGLVVGMLPTWGSYWSLNNPDRTIFNPENARSFGEYLGKRYRDNKVIWILGGDHNIHNDTERETVAAMAAGLQKGDGGKQLITFHPRGPGLSSDYFHDAEWLDFNMYQSSHAGHDHDTGLFAENDYALIPVKPTLDGEPRYETIPVGFYFRDFNRLDRFDDYDSRQAAYWSVLAGACGHTYGHNSIWQMYTLDRDPVLSATVPWQQALDHPGSFQMGILRQFFEARPFHMMRPAQEIILSGCRDGGCKIRAAVANDNSFMVVYSPQGERFTIDKSNLTGTRNKEIWFDPRYGIANHVHTADTKGKQTYTPPTSGRGNDWLLIVEDTSANYPIPGVNHE